MTSLLCNQGLMSRLVHDAPCNNVVRLQHVAVPRHCCLHKGVQTLAEARMGCRPRSVC